MVFFQFEIIINILVLSGSFEYLFYGSTTIINIVISAGLYLTFTVRGPTLVVRI